MRLSQLLLETLREAPADVTAPGPALLLRAGYVRRLADGSTAYLPLGLRLARAIEAIVIDELGRVGCQEIVLPATARDDPFAELLRQAVRSYRRLPLRLVSEARAGRLALRLCGADLDHERRLETLAAVGEACRRALGRIGLPSLGARSGASGASLTTALVLLDPDGADDVLACPGCGLALDPETARPARPEADRADALPLESVETPGTTTIESLAAFLGIGSEETAKAAFFSDGGGRLITTIVRGDCEVHLGKLAAAVAAAGPGELRPASVERIRASAMEPGYGSPVGAHDTLVVLDELAARSPNLVAGANRAGYHLRNVNAGRDFEPDVVADVAALGAGEPCPACGQSLSSRRGFRLVGLRAGAASLAPVEYLADDGTRRTASQWLGALSLDRIVACAAATHRDERGLRWPAFLAPFDAHLVTIRPSAPEVRETADALYEELRAAGLEILYDDRDESPGVKLTDAELLGMPWRIALSPRSLAAGGAEVSERSSGEKTIRPLAELAALIAGAST